MSKIEDDERRKRELDGEAVLFTNARMLTRTESLQVSRVTGSDDSFASTQSNIFTGLGHCSQYAPGPIDLKRDYSNTQKCEQHADNMSVSLNAWRVMSWAEFQQRLAIARKGDGEATKNLVHDVHGSFESTQSTMSMTSQPSLSYSMSSPNTSDSCEIYCNRASTRQFASFAPKSAKKELIENAVGALRADIATKTTAGMEQRIQSLIEQARDEVGREMIGQQGGVEIVLECLRDHSGKEIILIVGLHLVTILCVESAANRTLVSEFNGVEIMVDLLKRHDRQKPKIVERTLLALYESCRENEAAQSAAESCGGISAILAVMKTHRLEAGIQMHGLRALETLARDNAENTRTMREAGGIEATLAAMRSASSCEFIHELATDILGILLTDHEHTQIVVGAKGGVVDVVRALSLAAGSPTATISACTCLRYLAFEEDNRRRIAACGGAKVIIEAAEQMKASTTEAITSILLALGNATFDEPASKSLASKNGGVSTLVSIMAIHEDNVEVAEYVCRVLRNISDSRQSTKKACYKQGAVAAVATAMKNHVDAPGIQEHGAAMNINMLTGFPFAVRAAKLDKHLADISDLYSLHEPTSVQVDHLKDELESRRMSSISTILLSRRSGPNVQSSAASSTSTSQLATTAGKATRAPSSTRAEEGFGRNASTAAGSLSKLSSTDSAFVKPSGLASRQGSVATLNASEYGASMFCAAEPEITEEMIEY